MKEQIGDESVFLRIVEFKKGLIQFTDSANAMRPFVDPPSRARILQGRNPAQYPKLKEIREYIYIDNS